MIFRSLFQNVAIVSEKAVKDAGDEFGISAAAAGTGPYMITDYNPDVALKLTAFPDYYRGEASIKNLIIKPMRDSSTGLIAFENSELDFYPVPLANWNQIDSSGNYNTVLMPGNNTVDVWINPLSGKLQNKDVRLAIAYCIDKEAMNIAGAEGLATTATQIFNPDYMFGSPKSVGIQYEYNPEQATEHLAAPGHAH